MKKRILSILLTLCMTLCLTPISVFAEEVGAGGSAAIQLGADALSVLSKNVNTATAPTVYFGQNHENNPAAWRVIGYDGSGVTSSQGDITLLAAGAMGVIPFVDTILNNEYAPSNLKTAIDALAAKLTTEENAAVKKRALTSGSYDGENTDCVAGGQVDNAVFWPLSTAEAFAVNNDLRALEPAHPNWVTTAWWLRSPGSDKYHLAVVSSDGSVQYSGHTILIFNNHRTVRPAFKLNMNSVLFASAAVGGKPDGGLTPIPEYSGNEWKLTLLDSRRNFAVTEKTVSAAPDDTVTLNYKGATTGKNEYISVILADNNGAQYYGRVAQPTAESGTLGGSSDDIQIIVKSSESFAAPASDGMTRPDGNTGSYFMWLGSNGKLYAPGASVPADVTKLTAQFVLSEQFSLTPGGRYYFDLSAMNIPGTVNTGNIFGATSLPDTTLHYVPFTYAGTVNAYKLTTEMATTEEYAQKNKYPHSLFIADYAVTNDVSWDALNTADLIFGKNYASGGVDYTLRTPSAGSDCTGLDDSKRGVPQSNEWDTMLNKDSGYIQNWNRMFSWGQDVSSGGASYRAVRGYLSARFWNDKLAANSFPYVGFRPVLEVLNPDTLGSDGLKVVTLDLGGGTLGGSSDAIQIIVKKGESFTAPSAEGLPRPDGISEDAQLYWSDENGNCYKPGDTVPADVSMLSITGDYEVIYLPGTYGTGSAVTDMKPHNNILTLRGALFTRAGYTQVGWSTVDGGEKVYDFKDIYTKNEALTLYPVWNTNKYTITFDTNGGSEIAPITQDYGTEITVPDNPTRKGYTFKGWDKEIPETMPAENITVKAQWEINQYTITFDTNGGSEIAPITQDYGTEITAPDNPTRKGYTFKGWDKEIPEAMPAENIKVKAQWEINQYTITFDTNGGSEIPPITQNYGTEITAPDNPTRKGYTFRGWDKEIPKTMPAENIKVKAQWEINQYTITFDTNGGSEIAPITQDYGTQISAPDNPTRKGYTFKGWDKEIPETMPAENITVKAQWEINQYTIAFDTNGGSEIAPITQDYGTEITAPDNPTRKGYTFKGWDKEIPETMPAENITITARWKDTEKPTGEIIIGTNKWNEFLNELTFGIFFKDTQEVTINAVDNSGVVFVSYLVTDKELSEAELNSLVFRAYEEPFCIDPNGEYIVYVMLVDENINITYLRSDRITLDNIQPVISGIENGKTYCEAQTVIVDEKYVDTVTVNGKVVTLDADGGFVLPPTNGEQKIVVTDKAGNNAEMTVTVNNGHTFGEWVSDNDGKHTRKCTVDGCDAFETENCSGGNATCTEKAVCDVCGKAYGEFDGTNHKGGVQEWTTRTAFNHEQKWNCCGAVIVASEAHEWKDGVCRECGYVCLHNDADKDHICDYCKKTISEHVDKDKNHICDYCEKTISAHKDAPTKEIKKADTVTAKLPDDSKSPQTGDNSNLILWIALLIISGGVMKGVTAFGKNKKHSAKIKDK